MNSLTKTRKLTRLALLITLALILSYIETLIPAIPIPGAKLGLANVVTLIALCSMTFWDAFIIVIFRTIISSLLFTSLSALMYSLPAGLVCLVAMYFLLKAIKKNDGLITVSLISAVLHNMTQLLVAVIILETVRLSYLAPWLIILAIPTGLFVGISAKYLNKYLSKRLGNY
jgi:heptaprenyl diphosphate synthase